MRRLSVGFALAAVLLAAQSPAAPKVNRDSLKQAEGKLDLSLRTVDVTDPYDLLGFTRGVYLPGYGVVFSAEINLVQTLVSPFAPQLTVSDLEKIHRKKLARIPLLKQAMRQMMVEAADTVESMPSSEQVVVGITLYYRQFEIKEGLPRQVVMQAPRRALLDFKANRIAAAALDAQVRVQEF